ncbi:MAG TPA: hypothetical protein VEF05_15505 [Terriglobales bacterium]|nr:hypothetical protein [Terriglobales bacterium]
MNKLSNLLLIVVIGGALSFAAAQTATPPQSEPAGPGVVDPGHPRVNQVDNRLGNQKDRIQQGLKNGTLTKQQAEHLARNDKRIAAQERRDMAANGGHLTKQEQKQLNREENRNSKKIYNEKH